MTRGWARNCLVTSSLRLFSEAERVTIIPVATDMSSAGIWDTRPSPMVEVVYICMISVMLPCLFIVPTRMPPIKLISVIMIEIMASPFTNFVAPSMEPKKSASRCTLDLLILASCSSIRPVLRSASIAICFPGMASRVKRAATSATRSEPLVITMN